MILLLHALLHPATTTTGATLVHRYRMGLAHFSRGQLINIDWIISRGQQEVVAHQMNYFWRKKLIYLTL